MPLPPSDSEKLRSSRILPWLYFLGALLVVFLNAAFSAVHSPLGQEISAGESPGFAWLRTNITTCSGFGLVYVVVVCWLQLRQIRQSSFGDSRLVSVLVCLQFLSVVVIALLLFFRQTSLLSLFYAVLLISFLIQGVIAYRRLGFAKVERQSLISKQPGLNAGLFLMLLFILGAAISLLDPSWHRMEDQILLDSNFESDLRYVFPAVLSGITTAWIGIGMLVMVNGLGILLHKLHEIKEFKFLISFIIFFSLVSAYTVFLFLTLFYAISWQIHNLHLTSTVWQLVLFISVAGGILFSGIYYRILPRIPQPKQASLIGIVALTFGAAMLFPLTWFLTLRRNTKTCWILLPVSTLGACVAIGYVVLFGDLFNPWFTTFSYLKGAILKITSVIAAGTALVLIERFFLRKFAAPSNIHRLGIALAMTAILGFLPFYALGQYPEVKAVVLQFNELTRVDATFAREFVGVLGFDKWIHIGQRPPQNNNPHPWPQPWELHKSQPSRLPADFNLLVIIVDALRGDAFHSAGYHRNLTPFLDHWAREEGISFRRAYSQGGGSFAALPFLVGGRSRFKLYGPGLDQQNLYFKLAQAEGIEHYMLMKGFSPRDIYPPDFPVTELAIPRAVSDRHSATADEVFESARNAFKALPVGERFLCFLYLMDVHNDLYKKKDGMDFGDQPKDLYDHNLSYIDRAISRFVVWLKKEGFYDRTVILFTSDHGEQFWEHGASLHGHTVYEEEIRIPLILVSHGIRKRFEDVPAIAADMAPTIADLAGYSIDPPYDDPHMGISLVPLILGNEKLPYLERDVIGRASFKRRYFLYRNWEWKLVYFAELDLLQLFNVIEDPQEKNNMIAEEAQLAAELERALLDYLEMVERKTYRPTLSK
ncbi:MAG: sulfatase-like hydrolase/transferase [Desulfobacteraceae bacterium]|jgi:glucan phosphoethanolaminetransferase (alkaline phosphatase superfamily)|nr:sulfatase-like hydrolase/transferase [Desulfobacteraceae bacterium]